MATAAEQVREWNRKRGTPLVEKSNFEKQVAHAKAMKAKRALDEIRLVRDMMTDEEREAEINEMTNRKHDELRQQWQDNQDKKFGLIPGTTKGFQTFAKGVVDVGTQIADAAMEIPGIGTAVKELYTNFAPPGSKYHRDTSLEDKFKSALNPLD